VVVVVIVLIFRRGRGRNESGFLVAIIAVSVVVSQENVDRQQLDTHSTPVWKWQLSKESGRFSAVYSGDVTSHSSLPSKQKSPSSPCEWHPVISVGPASAALLVDEVVCAATHAAVAAITRSCLECMVDVVKTGRILGTG
jgi:hypothetical protein